MFTDTLTDKFKNPNRLKLLSTFNLMLFSFNRKYITYNISEQKCRLYNIHNENNATVLDEMK